MLEIIRSDGKKFGLFQTQDYRIFGQTGFDGLRVDISKEKKAFGDGDIVLGKRIPSRQLIINAVCTDTDLAVAKRFRNYIREFFNDDYTYKIIIEYKDIKREIDAELLQVGHPTNNIYKPQLLSLVFDATNPLFKSTDTFAQDIASRTPLLGFPCYIMAQRMNKQTPQGMSFGYFVFDKSVEIDNDGDKDTYFRAEIKAKDNVKNFKLIQSSTNYFLFTKDLKKGDKLVVDFENSYVELNGENANQYVDKTSKFFKIPKGTSTISFDATQGSSQVEVKLFYQKLYLGV